MNPQPHNPVSWHKLSLISTGFILILNVLANLFATNFKTEYLINMFDAEYLLFEIVLEGVGIFLCAVGTVLFTSKLSDFSFRAVILKMILFSFFYLLFCIIYQFIGYLAFTANGMNPKIIGSEFLNFQFFIVGMRYSFVFMVIWMVLKFHKKTSMNE